MACDFCSRVVVNLINLIMIRNKFFFLNKISFFYLFDSVLFWPVPSFTSTVPWKMFCLHWICQCWNKLPKNINWRSPGTNKLLWKSLCSFVALENFISMQLLLWWCTDYRSYSDKSEEAKQAILLFPKYYY